MTNDEIAQIKGFAGSSAWSIGGWARIFSVVLNRDVSISEAREAISEINGVDPEGRTYGDIERSTDPIKWGI